MSRQAENNAETLILSDTDFELFRQFFYRQTGMLFEDSKRYFVDKRLITRMEATNCKSVREYLMKARLQPSTMELQSLINSLTVNETYFFRDLIQIECLTYRIIPEILANLKGNRTIKIWSSPCSSGEEPYSIALHLLEFWPQVDAYEIEIFGTDIDTQMIAKASQGIYSLRSVQNLPPGILARYFTKVAGEQYQIAESLRDSISLKQVNIINSPQTRGYRDFDIIFSRNMLIYFDDQSRRIATDVFFDALKPGGFICLAPTESMNHITSLFRVRPFPGVTVYQKPL